MIQELNSLKIENAYREEPPNPPAREGKSRETYNSANSSSKEKKSAFEALLDKPDPKISADAQNNDIEIQI